MMKPVLSRLPAFLILLLASTAIHAIDYTYDTDGAGAGVITEGSGTNWNTSTANWNNAGTLFTWPDPSTDTAIFGGGTAGTAGTVNVGTVTANSITFNTPNAGSYTLTGGTITLDGATPTITANAAAAINSVLTGGAGMIKSGAGNLTLGGSSANTLTGTTQITAGTLTLNKTSGNAIAGDITVSGGILTWGSNNNQIADTANIIANGGLVSFNNRSETIASYTQISSGFSNATNNGGAINITGALTISGGNQFVVNSGGQLSANSMSFTGNGLLVGANNSSVVTTINVGAGGLTLGGQTIQLNLASAGNKGSQLNLSGTLTSTGSSIIRADGSGTPVSGSITQVNLGADRTIDVTSGTLTFDNSISVVGTGTTTKSGAGTLSLSVTANTNAINFGTLNITAGIVSLDDNGQLADSTIITNSGGQFTANAKTETIASYTQTGTATGLFTGTLAGVGGNLTVTGTTAISGGTTGLVVSSGSTFTTSTLNTSGFTGGIAVLIGQTSPTAITRLNIGSGGLVMNGQTITFNRPDTAGQLGNELTLNGNLTTSGANSIIYNADALITIAGAISQINLGAATRIFTINDTTPTTPPTTADTSDQTIIGVVIAGSGGITKEGAGNLILSGANSNTYTGDTNVNAGRLYLSKTAGRDSISGNLLVNSGGYVQLTQNNQIADASTVILSTGGYLDLNTRNETFTNLTKTGGTLQGTGGIISITGIMAVSGGGSNSATLNEGGTRYTVNSGGQTSANTVTFVGAGNSALLVGGNTAARIGRFIVGSGGITLQGNTVTLNRGAFTTTNAQGSELVLQGNLTASGTTNINRSGDLLGVTNLNLNGAERTFNITGGTTTINVDVVSNNLETTIATTTATATAGGINKTGAGILALNGTASYTGKTTVEAGAMQMGTNLVNVTTATGVTTPTTSTGSINDSIWLEVAAAGTFHNNTGGTYLYDGTVSGSGTFSGNFTIGSNSGSVLSNGIIKAGGSSTPSDIVTAGDQIGTITFANHLELAAPVSPATSTLRAELQIIGATGNASSSLAGNLSTWVAAIATNHASLVTGTPGNHDHLQVNGNLVLNDGGIISVVNPLTGGYVPAFGDVFNLLDWIGAITLNGFDAGANLRSGGLGGGDLDLPDIGALGYQWDVSQFTTHGIVVVVPEPSRAVLMLLGISLATLNRRRRK